MKAKSTKRKFQFQTWACPECREICDTFGPVKPPLLCSSCGVFGASVLMKKVQR